MVLKPDQERVKALLKETITLLCKNGLQFKNQFSIEAVIGVTLDEEEVFLVSVNELISADQRKSSGGEDQQASPASSASKTNHKRHGKRKLPKTESGGESGEDGSLSSDDGSSDDGDGGDDSGSETNTPTEKRQCKQEIQETASRSNNSENDNKSGIQIKEEVVDCVWTNPNTGTSQQLQPATSNFATSTSYTAPEQTLPELPDINMIQAGLITSQAQWLQQQDLQGTAYTMAMTRTPRTSTVTSANISQPVEEDSMNISHDSQQMIKNFSMRLSCSICPRIFYDHQSLENHELMHKTTYKFHCKFCRRGFLAKSDYEGHMTIHTGEKKFKCEICGKQYSYKKTLKDHMIFSHSKCR